MPLCPRSKLDPLAEYKTSGGWWVVMCPICALCSSRQTKDYDQAIFWFWQKHDYKTKETNMAPPTYRDGYKKGVEDAGRKILEELPLSGITDPVGVLYAIPRFLRKKLLTKKVTKWTGIITNEWSGSPTILELCDTEEEVKEFLAKNPKPLTEAIPIEIETEI